MHMTLNWANTRSDELGKSCRRGKYRGQLGTICAPVPFTLFSPFELQICRAHLSHWMCARISSHIAGMSPLKWCYSPRRPQ